MATTRSSPPLFSGNEYSLGDLARPQYFNQPLKLRHGTSDALRKYLERMLLIRRVEEKIGEGIESGDVVCPCHLGIGQEAIAVGVASSLRPTDRVFGNHRSHSHFLSLGGSAFELFAEVLGKNEGCSKGMGGSMHLVDAARGFVGSVPIVAGTIPLAVGAALAAKMDGNGDVALAFFGDGATEEGALHESLNLAASMKLPVLFVCENNLFSSHLHIRLRQPADRIARYALAHCVRAATIDGNDVDTIAHTASRLISDMRAGLGPAFLEVVTYRWRGHVGPREDNDVGVDRNSDLGLWKKRDPIKRLFDGMSARGWIRHDELADLDSQIVATLNKDWERAMAADYPPVHTLMDRVYFTRQENGTS